CRLSSANCLDDDKIDANYASSRRPRLSDCRLERSSPCGPPAMRTPYRKCDGKELVCGPFGAPTRRSAAAVRKRSASVDALGADSNSEGYGGSVPRLLPRILPEYRSGFVPYLWQALQA